MNIPTCKHTPMLPHQAIPKTYATSRRAMEGLLPQFLAFVFPRRVHTSSNVLDVPPEPSFFLFSLIFLLFFPSSFLGFFWSIHSAMDNTRPPEPPWQTLAVKSQTASPPHLLECNALQRSMLLPLCSWLSRSRASKHSRPLTHQAPRKRPHLKPLVPTSFFFIFSLLLSFFLLFLLSSSILGIRESGAPGR